MGGYEVTCEATQWGVGHGGLHTQKIQAAEGEANSTIRFIYDCGTSYGIRATEPILKQAVLELVDHSKEDIDALWISHLHEDHVNLLGRLKEICDEENIQIKRIFLPHLTDLERLTLALEASEEEDSVDEDLGYVEEDSFDWAGFLDDPVRYISDSFPDSEVNSVGSDVRPPRAVENTHALRKESIEKNWEDAFLSMRNTGDAGAILWCLAPFETKNWAVQVGANDPVGDPFQLLKQAVGNMKTADILDELKDKAARKQLRTFIECQLKNKLSLAPTTDQSLLNSTSIVLYSGPLSDIQNDRTVPVYRVALRQDDGTPSEWIFQANFVRYNDNAAWLGTGDANLLDPRIRAEFEDHYEDVLEKIWWASIPHHASGKDSDSQLWERFSNLQVLGMQTSTRGGHKSVAKQPVILGALNRAPLVLASDCFSHRFTYKQEL